ncbi:MAG TPA: LPS assembly lipoprotein LptE [Vitreimonas sp.]|uniref:LPS assembly lipoprotein LptE n=1 Tax=Vitreimonas sp. TaxID=3069702 RepID=UPI002D39E6C5|nr:LPS assembly lipoprotein LptE [Vitreimonas sp.]HYD89557.1 LPS assembly lipoprotein LptE [Vitreimonas sp.]
MRVLIASLTLLLAACGFQPMYAPAGGGPAIGPVSIEEIEGKAGHVLRTELSRILSVENGDAPPSQLEITLLEQVTPLGIRRDESATRAELRLIANYVLTPPQPGAQVMRGSVVTVVNYDIPTAAFGEIAAQDDARERAAETMAQRFRAELALRMAQAREAGAAR